MILIRNFLIFLLMASIVGCTGNPFGSDEIRNPNERIEGTVRLSDDAMPDDVLVWLEGFEIAAKTDERGDFSLRLPPAGLQPGDSGVDGIFDLIFYLGNYRRETRPVTVFDGEFLFNQDGLDRDGRFFNEIFLAKILDFAVETTPERAVIPPNGKGIISLSLKISLGTSTLNGVTVFYPTKAELAGTEQEVANPIFLRNVETDSVVIFSSAFAGGEFESVFEVTRQNPKERRTIVQLNVELLEAGTYEIIPYLFVLDNPPPDALAARTTNLNVDYVDIPFKRKNGRFMLLDSEPDR